MNDAATAMLMAKFYDLHMGGGLAPPTALRQAQVWLRQATNTDLADYARFAARQGKLSQRHTSKIEQELSVDGLARSRNAAAVEWVSSDATRAPSTMSANSPKQLARPYAHRYFWAGFIYTGQ